MVYSAGGDSLMKDGPWELIPTNKSVIHRYNLYSFIMHTCAASHAVDVTHQYWWSLDFIDSKCHTCGEYPPDDMMGLWKLHNWDYIGTRGERS
jgi:hypothetical protein